MSLISSSRRWAGLLMSFALTGGAAAPLATAQTAPSPIPLVGVNLAGGEFGSNVPGKFGTDYTFPNEAQFRKQAERGFKLVRLPFRWERIRPSLGADLDAAELGRLRQTLDYADKYGIKVILDMHNYYRYYKQLIATEEVPIVAFADTWRRLAQQLGSHPALYGYGLMNEPYNTNGFWPQAALAASRAIREVETGKWIFVAGDRYSSAYHFPGYNANLIADPWMRDPANKLVYEGHLYLDRDFSGKYLDKEAVFDPQVGVNRARPFVDWLRQNGLRGYIGEHGVPDWSPTAIVAMDNLLAYLAQHCVISTYWAGGPWWGNYVLSLDVSSNAYRPQLPVLQKHMGYTGCTTLGPAG